MAGLVAGAMSMAAGEYVSVHSQADTERADLDIERVELKKDNRGEHKELEAIYVVRGLDHALAKQVVQQLMAHDALGAHASDELGISKTLRPRPVQAALSSAASFAVGALMPLLATAIAPTDGLIPLVSLSSLVLLALLGGYSAAGGPHRCRERAACHSGCITRRGCEAGFDHRQAAVRRLHIQALAAWRESLLAHSILPIQQFRNTVHKNASDSALIIDAMDLLHSGKFDGFCIVSSDSDFTRLASRIREEGLLVFGFGETQTPKSFVAACNRFIYTEIFRKAPAESREAAEPQQHPADLHELTPKLVDAVESCADDSGWAMLARVGSVLANHLPDFDPRHYGFRDLSALAEAADQLEIEKRGAADAVQILVRVKTPS